jgi:hypothetical protein
MTNIETKAIVTGLRMARERAEAEGATHRDMEIYSMSNIENLLQEIRNTPQAQWLRLYGGFDDRRWWPPEG